jgi:hypothetical protein
MAAVAKQGMSPYEAARERTVQENKRKMEALNLHHLSAAIKMAPKTPSPMVMWPSLFASVVSFPVSVCSSIN